MYKYFMKDFKENNKGLVGLYLTSLISSLIVLISNNYKNSIDIFAALFVIAMGVSTISIIICFILPFARYSLNTSNMFKKEIKEIDYYDAKVLSMVATIMISFLIMGVSFVNTYSNHTVFKFIGDLFEDRTLAKNFTTFGIELSVKVLFIYMTTLLAVIIGERSKDDKKIKAIIYTIIIVASVHYLIKFLVQIIMFERKFVLMIFLYILANIVIFFIGRYECKNALKYKQNI